MSRRIFLDTQASLEPTPVSQSVSWLVGWLVTLSDFFTFASLVATIAKEVTTIAKEVATIT